MASPNRPTGKARATEQRYETAIRDVMMERLGTTPEWKAWCEAELEVLKEYGGHRPFQVAASAWESGNMKLYELALADDARLTALEEAARSADERH